MKNAATQIIPFPNRDQIYNNTILLFIDLQLEYTASGRAYALQNSAECLNNCRRLLETARSAKLTIAHFRQLRPGTFFNPETEFSKWIEEFRPRPNEMVFERDQPSVYSNRSFESFVNEITWPELIICGLTGEMGCLSTAIDAAHREHKVTFVSDASASRSLHKYSEEQSHEAVTKIIDIYVQLGSTEDVISRISNKGMTQKIGPV